MVILIWPLGGSASEEVKMAVHLVVVALHSVAVVSVVKIYFSDEEPTEGEEASLEGGEIAEGGEATR
jgi:hypothetical protein